MNCLLCNYSLEEADEPITITNVYGLKMYLDKDCAEQVVMDLQEALD